MTKTIVASAFLILILASCIAENESSAQNEIAIGKYTFIFPSDFKLTNEQGIDSHVGKISNDTINFQFDYGYYSNQLTSDLHEYFARDVLKWNALASNNLLPSGRDPQYYSHRTKLLNFERIDSNIFQVNYFYENDTVRYTDSVPVQIANSQIEIDTINSVVYKYVNGPEYIGLHARDLNSFNKSINAFKSLTITVDLTSQIDAIEVLRILKTCRHNR